MGFPYIGFGIVVEDKLSYTQFMCTVCGCFNLTLLRLICLDRVLANSRGYSGTCLKWSLLKMAVVTDKKLLIWAELEYAANLRHSWYLNRSDFLTIADNYLYWCVRDLRLEG